MPTCHWEPPCKSICCWSKLKSFESPQAYDDYVSNAEDEIPWLKSANEHGWDSDSCNQYYDVAQSLDILRDQVDKSIRTKIDEGLMPLFSEEPLDDAGFRNTLECCFFSASPTSVARMWSQLQALDLQSLDQLSDEEPADELDDGFISFLNPVKAVIREAQRLDYGILGYIG